MASAFKVRLTTTKARFKPTPGPSSSNRSNINNLGDGVAASTALTSALSRCPQQPLMHRSLWCGSGAYQQPRCLPGVGCAAKLQERLSLNVGGSTVFGRSATTAVAHSTTSLCVVALSSSWARSKPAASNRQLQSKVEVLEKTNATIIKENAAIKGKYSTIEQQNKALMARLERLRGHCSRQ